MPSRRTPRTAAVARAAAVAFAVLGAFAPRAARADDRADCLAAHADAQLLRRDGKLGAARARLIECSRPVCPALVAKDCTQWVGEVDAERPSIVFAAHDESGRDVARARIFVDGTLLLASLDGRAVGVDPGEHVVRCDFGDGRSMESRIVVSTGEKDRTIRFDLAPAIPSAPAAPPPRSEGSSALSPLAIGLGTASALALGTFAYFAISGKSRESELSSSCRPNCAQDDVDEVKRRYVAADVSLGIAAVTLGAALLVTLTAKHGASF